MPPIPKINGWGIYFVSVYFCGLVCISAQKWNKFRCQNVANRIQTTIKIEPKGCQNGSRNETQIKKREPSRTRCKKGAKKERPWHEMEAIFGQKSIKKQSPKTKKKQSRTNMKITPKGFRNGTNIDAETHDKSMQKLAPKQSKTIIKNHVFLKCKNM